VFFFYLKYHGEKNNAKNSEEGRGKNKRAIQPKKDLLHYSIRKRQLWTGGMGGRGGGE